MSDGERITAAATVPADSTFLFTVDGEDGEDEAVLTRAEDGVEGYVNRCMHFTHIRLDKGSGAPVRNGELVCANHGAMFEQDTGVCTFGPCEGAQLDRIDIDVRDGGVYLVDDDYAFVRTGGIESDPADLASTSNVEF
ncbi:Rieske (2Fe-2S) protein [Salarchaeum sp. JOR-1]|uniref:Rieske (2Fe-2S) protein n=1 Tax=Salarchaeum sp. JOR-1 TaxID=2599399 RepID=UPI0011986959|nr:Rieske (2Fe-2S) protein [Salarchaeum sp. JOR-1]QDX39691.1 Rieske (2Fe-2S) protein [Salarchaeum sp. JOR-1]